LTEPHPVSDANTNRPLSVLHVIPNYFPATRWGGPVFSTKAICDGLAALPGVTLRVVTTDAAGPAWTDTLPLTARQVTMSAGYEVTYYRRVLRHSISPGLLAALPGAIRAADIVHVTSTYSFPTLPTLALARLMRRPVVWSPRGAIQASEEWSAAPRQGLKRAFEAIAVRLAPRKTVVHVTAESEAAATARRLIGMRTVVIPNSVDIPTEAEIADRVWRPDGRLRLLFLSRVHEKKGLDDLLTALVGLPELVELDIYGTGEASYLNKVAAQVSGLGLSGRVHFHGHVDGAVKAKAFRQADLFVLPSYSENFGIVVAEALARGVPVLTTRATPWSGLETHDCGRAVDVGAEPLAAAIFDLADANLAEMGARGRAWMVRDFSAASMNAAMFELYRDLTMADNGQDRHQ